jgi:hypothetical protein
LEILPEDPVARASSKKVIFAFNDVREATRGLTWAKTYPFALVQVEPPRYQDQKERRSTVMM